MRRQLRLAGRPDVRGALRLPRRRGRGRGDPADLAVLEEVDRAPVRESRYGQPDDVVERRLVVGRGGQQGARVGEKFELLLELAAFGHLAHDRADAERLACVAGHRVVAREPVAPVRGEWALERRLAGLEHLLQDRPNRVPERAEDLPDAAAEVLALR